MQANRFFPLLKVLSVVVLLTMIVATAYAFAVSLLLWSGIGV